jgi:NADH dehydrogenase (ubiquinone) 1 beta subcomplex subunit 3
VDSKLSQPAAEPLHGAVRMGFNWERYEAWRKHPMLSNNLRHSLPGLGIATVAFGVFVAYDKLVAGNSGGHH